MLGSLLITWLALAAAGDPGTCDASPESPVVAALGELLGQGRVYMGCRPSAGECQMSCPDRRGWSEVDPSRCDPDNPFSPVGGVACYCLTDEPQPVEVPEGATFIGCRPSPSECRYSCPPGGVFAAVDPAICDPDDPSSPAGGVACYCLGAEDG